MLVMAAKELKNLVLFGSVGQILYCPNPECTYKYIPDSAGTFELKCYGCHRYYTAQIQEARKYMEMSENVPGEFL